MNLLKLLSMYIYIYLVFKIVLHLGPFLGMNNFSLVLWTCRLNMFKAFHAVWEVKCKNQQYTSNLQVLHVENMREMQDTCDSLLV